MYFFSISIVDCFFDSLLEPLYLGNLLTDVKKYGKQIWGFSKYNKKSK